MIQYQKWGVNNHHDMMTVVTIMTTIRKVTIIIKTIMATIMAMVRVRTGLPQNEGAMLTQRTKREHVTHTSSRNCSWISATVEDPPSKDAIVIRAS